MYECNFNNVLIHYKVLVGSFAHALLSMCIKTIKQIYVITPAIKTRYFIEYDITV